LPSLQHSRRRSRSELPKLGVTATLDAVELNIADDLTISKQGSTLRRHRAFLKVDPQLSYKK
jgi:hypothetical protein